MLVDGAGAGGRAQTRLANAHPGSAESPDCLTLNILGAAVFGLDFHVEVPPANKHRVLPSQELSRPAVNGTIQFASTQRLLSVRIPSCNVFGGPRTAA